MERRRRQRCGGDDVVRRWVTPKTVSGAGWGFVVGCHVVRGVHGGSEVVSLNIFGQKAEEIETLGIERYDLGCR